MEIVAQNIKGALQRTSLEVYFTCGTLEIQSLLLDELRGNHWALETVMKVTLRRGPCEKDTLNPACKGRHSHNNGS